MVSRRAHMSDYSPKLPVCLSLQSATATPPHPPPTAAPPHVTSAEDHPVLKGRSTPDSYVVTAFFFFSLCAVVGGTLRAPSKSGVCFLHSYEISVS